MGYFLLSHLVKFSKRKVIACGFKSHARTFSTRFSSLNRGANAGPTPQNGSQTEIDLFNIFDNFF